MEDVNYTRHALLQAPAVDGDPERLLYLIERLPLFVSRIEAAIQKNDKSQLGALAHDGKGLYAELGRAGEHFARIYLVAHSGGSQEVNDIVEALRAEVARLQKALGLG